MLSYKTKTNLLNIDLILEKLDIKNGDSVADFGCGANGFFTFLCSKKVGEKGKVYGLDIIKSHLEKIKTEIKENKTKNIVLLWADLEKPVNISPESLDIVIISNVLHQTGKWDKVLKSAYQCLKKGGKLLIIDWLKVNTLINPITKVDKQKLVQEAQNLGFLGSKEFMAGEYSFGLIITK